MQGLAVSQAVYRYADAIWWRILDDRWARRTIADRFVPLSEIAVYRPEARLPAVSAHRL